MDVRRSLMAIFGVLLVVGIGIGIWWWRSAQVQQDASPALQDVTIDQSPKEEAVSDPEPAKIALPQGERVTFENVPVNCGVIKGKAERYTYDFFCDDKVFGHMDMSGNWHIDHFLSYEGGDELFGFFPDRSGEEGKYYWGPSVLYKANTERGTLVKLLDVSLWATPGETAPRSAWGSKYFIMDVSSDQSLAIYGNYFADNALFTRNLSTGEVRKYPIDASLYDFGDASFSDDGKKVAFAGLKMKKDTSGKPIGFIEAEVFVLDLASGKITIQETKREPGMYSVNGWIGDKADFEYLSMEE